MNEEIYKNSTLDHSRDQLKAFQKNGWNIKNYFDNCCRKFH